MEVLSTSLDLKSFQSLLNGLNQIIYAGRTDESETGIQVLQEKVFKSSSLDFQEQRNEISLFEAILRKAAQDNWSVDSLQEFLTRRSFPADFTQIFVRFWTRESLQVRNLSIMQLFLYSYLDA